jgi:hypothetical protein
LEVKTMFRTTLIRIFFLLSIFAVCSSFLACDIGCSEEFAIFTVSVVDDNNQPVASASVTVRNKRTGKVYDVSDRYQKGEFGEGVYVIFDDSFAEEVSRIAEHVLVEVRKGNASVEAEFVFRADFLQCHVHQVSGPSRIVLSE